LVARHYCAILAACFRIAVIANSILTTAPAACIVTLFLVADLGEGFHSAARLKRCPAPCWCLLACSLAIETATSDVIGWVPLMVVLGDALSKVLVAHANVALARVLVGSAVNCAVGEKGKSIASLFWVAF
jgi:hypothetical protein